MMHVSGHKEAKTFKEYIKLSDEKMGERIAEKMGNDNLFEVIEELERLRRKVERQKATIKSWKYIVESQKRVIERKELLIARKDKEIEDLEAHVRDLRFLLGHDSKPCDVCQIVELKPKY
jgi:Ribonuclease G/E